MRDAEYRSCIQRRNHATCAPGNPAPVCSDAERGGAVPTGYRRAEATRRTNQVRSGSTRAQCGQGRPSASQGTRAGEHTVQCKERPRAAQALGSLRGRLRQDYRRDGPHGLQVGAWHLATPQGAACCPCVGARIGQTGSGRSPATDARTSGEETPAKAIATSAFVAQEAEARQRPEALRARFPEGQPWRVDCDWLSGSALEEAELDRIGRQPAESRLAGTCSDCRHSACPVASTPTMSRASRGMSRVRPFTRASA